MNYICPICNKNIKVNEYVIKCSRCNRIYHSNCWVKHKGCVTEKCKSIPSKQIKIKTQAELDKLFNENKYNPKNIRILKCPKCSKIILNGEKKVKCHLCNQIYHEKCLPDPNNCSCITGKHKQKHNHNHSNNTVTYKERICPYCMMTINQDDSVVVCPKCGIPHHKDCWQENGGCTTYGCNCKLGEENRIRSASQEQNSDSVICPHCNNPIRSDELTKHCNSCGVIYHDRCWVIHKGCKNPACRQGSLPANTNPPLSLPPINNETHYPPPTSHRNNTCFNCCAIIIAIIIIFFIIPKLF